MTDEQLRQLEELANAATSDQEKIFHFGNTFKLGDAARTAIPQLIARIRQLEKALVSIKDTPTMDSACNTNHTNTWTKWAKNKAREALEGSDEEK